MSQLAHLTSSAPSGGLEHPLAGLQLVKGGVEPGESTDLADVRELIEEAGIQSTLRRNLGNRPVHLTLHGDIYVFYSS
jgi:8-oxo-dGTP pyrophosphatase MutT (NUDIX family)